MLERIQGEIHVTCDGPHCSEFYIGSDGFEETLSELRNEGWRFEKKGRDWFHYCPDCLASPHDISKITKGL